jgi:integrase
LRKKTSKNCGFQETEEMINRDNWKLTKKYLVYREEIDQISGDSCKVEAVYIRYILEWANSTSFQKAEKIRPSLPEYLIKNRLDGKTERLSSSHIKKTLTTARRLFTWIVDNNSGYRSIKISWIKTLKPKRLENPPKQKEAVTLEEVLKIAAAPADNLTEKRIRAAAVFLFLSGMRIGAFVSLPIKAVDIKNRVIKQFPNLGVKTKNKKYGITYLLDIPELLSVVSDWDKLVRSLLPENGFWFAPFSPDTWDIDSNCIEIGKHRDTLARKNLRLWLNKVGLPYHSPHKFRHGHIHYGIEHSKTIADFKAVSMNVLHSSMDITDEIYSKLCDKEIKKRIDSISNNNNSTELEDTYSLFQEFLAWRDSKQK